MIRALALIALIGFIAFALGVGAMVLREPRACDHVTVLPYKLGERPVCVIVHRVAP